MKKNLGFWLNSTYKKPNLHVTSLVFQILTPYFPLKAEYDLSDFNVLYLKFL
jgi:hypothetical protein